MASVEELRASIAGVNERVAEAIGMLLGAQNMLREIMDEQNMITAESQHENTAAALDRFEMLTVEDGSLSEVIGYAQQIIGLNETYAAGL